MIKKLEEKNLIILELEKVILDFMTYNKVIFVLKIKKIVNHLESESSQDKYPDYFKCPITWEKINDPVIVIEDGQT